jgi:hypothetical protein
MSDRVFYVGARPQSDENRITGYVPAKFLTVNGKPVVDPVPGGSQDAHIYADGSDKYKTSGAIANPNNYLIVPANYTEQQAWAFAAHIAGTMDLGPIGQALALNRMKDAFWSNGPQDLQRHPQWGIPENSFVPAFIDSASYHLGSVTRWAGIPETLSDAGGGIPHWLSPPPDKSEFRGLSERNYKNISKGFSDANLARTVPSLMNDFGYNPLAQFPADQIGDGNGLGVGDWRFPFAGVDSSNPTRPVPPLQTDSQPAPRLVRVSDNRSPAAPASSIAPSDNRSFLGDRFGKWGSAATGAAPLPASDRPESFDNRFGNWGFVPTGGLSDTGSPVLRTLARYQRSALPDGASSSSGQAAGSATNLPGEKSAFGDQSGNAPNAPGPDNYPPRRVSSAFPVIAPLSPNRPASPPERTPPLGPARYLVGQSHAPVPDASAPAAPVAPSSESNFSGGLLGRLAALMGVDPENPTQLASPPLDDQLRGFYRDDPLQPWFVQRQR